MRFRSAIVLCARLAVPALAAAAESGRLQLPDLSGVAIIAAQPRQLTIVNIVGSIDLAKLAQLQGKFGVPKVGLTVSGAAPSASVQAH